MNVYLAILPVLLINSPFMPHLTMAMKYFWQSTSTSAFIDNYKKSQCEEAVGSCFSTKLGFLLFSSLQKLLLFWFTGNFQVKGRKQDKWCIIRIQMYFKEHICSLTVLSNHCKDFILNKLHSVTSSCLWPISFWHPCFFVTNIPILPSFPWQ